MPELINNDIAIAYVNNIDTEQAKKIANQWGFNYIGDAKSVSKNHQLKFLLQVNNHALELIKCDEPKLYRGKCGIR